MFFQIRLHHLASVPRRVQRLIIGHSNCPVAYLLDVIGIDEVVAADAQKAVVVECRFYIRQTFEDNRRICFGVKGFEEIHQCLVIIRFEIENIRKPYKRKPLRCRKCDFGDGCYMMKYAFHNQANQKYTF